MCSPLHSQVLITCQWTHSKARSPCSWTSYGLLLAFKACVVGYGFGITLLIVIMIIFCFSQNICSCCTCLRSSCLLVDSRWLLSCCSPPQSSALTLPHPPFHPCPSGTSIQPCFPQPTLPLDNRSFTFHCHDFPAHFLSVQPSTDAQHVSAVQTKKNCSSTFFYTWYATCCQPPALAITNHLTLNRMMGECWSWIQHWGCSIRIWLGPRHNGWNPLRWSNFFCGGLIGLGVFMLFEGSVFIIIVFLFQNRTL